MRFYGRSSDDPADAVVQRGFFLVFSFYFIPLNVELGQCTFEPVEKKIYYWQIAIHLKLFIFMQEN